MRKWWMLVGSAVAAVVGAAPGCSATSGSGDDSSGGQGGVGGTIGTGGSLGGFGNTCNGQRCSSDLHSVVDCQGNLIRECPPDQGCSGGGCVPACQSAEDNKSTYGCEYFLWQPDVLPSGGARGGCYAAFVVNTWSEPVGLTVEFNGQVLNSTQFSYLPVGQGSAITYQPLSNNQVPPGEVAIVFLNWVPKVPLGIDPNCPAGVTAAFVGTDMATHGTTMGPTFRIGTTAPVVMYDIYPYGGGRSALTSATLLLPTSAWGTNYVAVDAFGLPGPLAGGVVAVVSQEDGTQVTLNPKVNIAAGNGVAAATAGQPAQYTVNRGQVLQFTQTPSLVGSVIQADRPIGVWGGKLGLGIEACCDDSAHQQIPPVKALGSEYAAVRYRNRYDDIGEESPPWRLVGAARGTVLTYEPSTPPGAPTLLERGQVAQFNAPGPFIVRSQDAQHPFYMSAHMTGAGLYDPQMSNESVPMDGRGDAEFVNVIPPGEFLDKYVFFTDPTYPETNLVLVRVRDAQGFADVELDCAGVLTGWQPIGTSGQYEYTRFDLITGNFEPNGNCNNGRHVISSRKPFGLTVWGWGSAATGSGPSGFNSQYVSYAYPAGAGVAPINDVVVPVVE